MRNALPALFAIALLAGCSDSTQPTQPEGRETELAFDSSKSTTEQELAEFRQKRLDELVQMRTMSFKSYFSTLEKDSSRIGNNPGSSKICSTMRRVGLGCSYNERIMLSEYLAANGKNLFPCGDGSNPYFATTKDCDSFRPEELMSDSFYIGQPGQSVTLEQSIRKNAKLFKNGDLTPEAAARWQLMGNE